MLIDNWRQSWKMLSVQIQAIWGTACVVFAAMSDDRQEGLLSLFGVSPEGAAAAAFVAQFSAAFAGATIAARIVAQPSVHRPSDSGART